MVNLKAHLWYRSLCNNCFETRITGKYETEIKWINQRSFFKFIQNWKDGNNENDRYDRKSLF